MERILVADDYENARGLLTAVLESRGYRVTVVSNGLEALEELDDSSPDLMLLDIEMPRMDGCEVCTYVKNRDDTRRIPVILVSGLPDTATRARQAGADGFVAKPFSLDTLLTEVRRLLPNSASAQATQAAGSYERGLLTAADCAAFCVGQ